MSALTPQADRPYRKGVGIVLFNSDGLVFAARRIDSKEPAWQFPQGGIDDNEDPLAAAWREMKEEIGTDHAKVIGESAEWIAYDLPAEIADKSWKGRYRGQRQKWFAFQFLGRDSDIDITAQGTDQHAEFCEWRWMKLADVPGLIVPFKRDLYDQVAAEFAGLAGL
jgi:putative (di)nucleoside polyphosphate hydrolase